MGGVTLASDLGALISTLWVGKGNYELWKPFLSLVLILMMTESIVARRWDGQNVKRKNGNES